MENHQKNYIYVQELSVTFSIDTYRGPVACMRTVDCQLINLGVYASDELAYIDRWRRNLL